MPRWYENDDSYLSQRYPTFFGGDPYGEIGYDDLYPSPRKNSRIGPVTPTGKKPTNAKIGPAPKSWLDRLGEMMGPGYPNTPAPQQTPPYVDPRQEPIRRNPTIGPVRQPLGGRLPAGNYQDTAVPQTLTTRSSSIGPGLISSRNTPMSARPATIGPSSSAGQSGAFGAYGEEPMAPNAMDIARMRPGGIGAFMSQGSVPMGNTGRPGPPRPAGTYPNVTGTGRPPVRQAGGVTNPASVTIDGRPIADIGIGFNPRSYPGATRVAAAARRAASPGIPSGVPIGGPPGGISAPESSPIQSVPQQNPYEPPIGESGWTRNAPGPFMGPNAQSGPGAWNRFDITQEGGRNAGAEGNFPGTQAGPTEEEIRQGPGFGAKAGNPNDSSGYNWGPTEAYNQYLESEPSRQQYKPGGWTRLLNAATAGMYGYETKDIPRAIALGTQLNDRPYDNAVEEWKRRGSGLARAVDMEDKRYKLTSEHQNRMADNARQERELDLRRQALILQDREFMQKVSMDDFKMMTEGWQKSVGPNDKMILFRMGPNGYEQKETNLPNSELTAAEKRADSLAQRELSAANARLAANTSRANTRDTNAVRVSEGKLTRQHQATEGMLGRAVRLETAGMNRGVTGGEDYASPGRLLGSPDFRDLSGSGLVKIINAPDNQGKPRVVFSYEDPNELQAALEKAAGGDGAKLRRLSDQLRTYQDYVQQWGGGQ